MRRPIAALVAATTALTLAGSASAATVRMDRVVETDEGETSVYGNVHVTAGAGEVNSLTVQVFPAHASGPGSVVVTDEKTPPTAGERCAQLDPKTVLCRAPDVPSISSVLVDAGDMDDDATLHPASENYAYVALRGGLGADTLRGTWVRLEGGPADDLLVGGSGRETLLGDEGNDHLEGNGGDDGLDGGTGDDLLRGGEGNDQLHAGGSFGQPGPAGRDELEGGAGNDTLSDEDGLDTTPEIGPDVVIGGEGSDTLNSYILRKAPVRVDLRLGTNPQDQFFGQGQEGENDILDGLESVTGGSAADILTGNEEANYIDGGAGRDLVRTWGGDDRVYSRVSPAIQRQNASAHLYGPDRVETGIGNDLIETTPTMESRIACDEGDDTILFEGYASANDRAHSSVGPLVSRTCERMVMHGSPRLRTGVEIDPSPVRVTRERLVFSFFDVRCCDHVLELKKVKPPERDLGTARVRRNTVSVWVGRRIVRRSRKQPVRLRGKVTKVAVNRFVWRFEFGRRAF